MLNDGNSSATLSITGINLGLSEADVAGVSVGARPCTVSSSSPTAVTAICTHSGQKSAMLEGRVALTTASGGKGVGCEQIAALLRIVPPPPPPPLAPPLGAPAPPPYFNISTSLPSDLCNQPIVGKKLVFSVMRTKLGNINIDTAQLRGSVALRVNSTASADPNPPPRNVGAEGYPETELFPQINAGWFPLPPPPLAEPPPPMPPPLPPAFPPPAVPVSNCSIARGRDMSRAARLFDSCRGTMMHVLLTEFKTFLISPLPSVAAPTASTITAESYTAECDPADQRVEGVMPLPWVTAVPYAFEATLPYDPPTYALHSLEPRLSLALPLKGQRSSLSCMQGPRGVDAGLVDQCLQLDLALHPLGRAHWRPSALFGADRLQRCGARRRWRAEHAHLLGALY